MGEGAGVFVVGVARVHDGEQGGQQSMATMDLCACPERCLSQQGATQDVDGAGRVVATASSRWEERKRAREVSTCRPPITAGSHHYAIISHLARLNSVQSSS